MGPNRRNLPTGPVGRVSSNFGDHEDQVYLVPSNYCNWLSFFLWLLREAYNASSAVRIGNGMVKHWRRDNGRQERNGGGNEEDRHPPHVRSLPTFQPWLRLRPSCVLDGELGIEIIGRRRCINRVADSASTPSDFIPRYSPDLPVSESTFQVPTRKGQPFRSPSALEGSSLTVFHSLLP